MSAGVVSSPSTLPTFRDASHLRASWGTTTIDQAILFLTLLLHSPLLSRRWPITALRLFTSHSTLPPVLILSGADTPHNARLPIPPTLLPSDQRRVGLLPTGRDDRLPLSWICSNPDYSPTTTTPHHPTPTHAPALPLLSRFCCWSSRPPTHSAARKQNK